MNLEELIDKYEQDRYDFIECDKLSIMNALKAVNDGATDIHICSYMDQIKDCEDILRQLHKIIRVISICKDYIKIGIDPENFSYILSELED